MNAIEAISDGPQSSSGELAKALLARLNLGVNREVRDAVASYLGEKMSLDITESLKEPGLSGDEALRAAALSILDQRISTGLVANRDGTVEFLYRILRGEHEPSRRSAAIMLWKLGDDYAPEVLRDFLLSGTDEQTTDILRRLQGSLRESFIPLMGPLFVRGNVSVQAALRDLLLQAKEPAVGEKALAIALHLRGGSLDEPEDSGLAQDAPDAVDLRQERTAFQFEREHIQEMVMFFSDIQGYSKKAQNLTPMQLNTLLQDYEKILLAHTEAHRGELVKRMGDGHMFVFHSPLNAVLAAIRLQKSLLRFNRYRDESTRVVIRIGIHMGKVVRKAQGDVLGNAVNIAARLESSARPGSVLISDAVQAMVKDAVHAREIGHIIVKNISEPIKVFEPYEIVLDLPADLDPLKQTRSAAQKADGPDPESGVGEALGPDGKDAGEGPAMPAAALAEIDRCFTLLLSLCRAAEEGKVPVAAVEEKVLAPWRLLRPRLLGAERRVE
jgi:class 3 adenylate cyclase